MKKILVVNNDMDTMSLLQQLLETKGYQVKYSGNDAEVHQLLAQFQPDLLLVDILQINTIEALPDDMSIKKPPVIMMTGYNNQYDKPHFIADATLKKPFSLKELEDSIMRFI